MSNAREVVARLTGPVTGGLMLDLIEAQDKQLALLTAGARLREGPWQKARVHLHDAALPGRSRQHVRRSLMLCMAQLHDAVPALEEGTCERAQARLDLAISFVLLDDLASARHHAELAYREARHAMWLLVNGSKGPRSLLATAFYLRGRRGDPIARISGDDLVPIARWYDQVEWCCGFIGDPEGPMAGAEPPLVLPLHWREGAALDFAFISHKQRLMTAPEEFRTIPLARAVRGTPDPLTP